MYIDITGISSFISCQFLIQHTTQPQNNFALLVCHHNYLTTMDFSLMKARDEEHERIGQIFNGFRRKLMEYETLIKTELGEFFIVRVSKFVPIL